ncbi:MAG: 3-isopropylmalate dehydrogenase [Thermodesulfobacteriota bacterium]|nr:3-isopropylmalate dehydrogenase [Thermodesulfobacteriota bacterium]
MKIVVLPGDGIGKDVANSAADVLKEIVHDIELDYALIGGCAYDATGTPLPDETIDKVKKADAVLMGAVGGAKWDKLDYNLKPEAGLLKIRSHMKVFANLRPIKVFKPLLDSSPLKRDIIDGIDLVIVRELTGGIYFGTPKGIEQRDGVYAGYNTLIYTTPEIERVARIAFSLAEKRDMRLTSVDKANVLESSKLWRDTVNKIADDYPNVEVNHIYVDNCAMQLIRDPRQFDVILTQNLFGDILSDEASMVAGSLGMLPSGSIGDGHGLYEPVHGSAPDIAGTDMANPIGAIMSAAMMLRHSFDMKGNADQIECAIDRVLSRGIRTPDIAFGAKEIVGTKKMTGYIIDEIGGI